MKRIFALAVSVMAASVVFAGGVDNKTNLNAGYERNPSRNTECKRPEAVFYNIGGISFMDDGLYVEAGDQLVFKNYANKLDFPSFNALGINKSYEDNRLVYLYPNAEVVYKKGDSAVFFGFGVFGGGGNLEYNDGTAATGLAFAGKAMKSGLNTNEENFLQTLQRTIALMFIQFSLVKSSVFLQRFWTTFHLLLQPALCTVPSQLNFQALISQ